MEIKTATLFRRLALLLLVFTAIPSATGWATGGGVFTCRSICPNTAYGANCSLGYTGTLETSSCTTASSNLQTQGGLAYTVVSCSSYVGYLSLDGNQSFYDTASISVNCPIFEREADVDDAGEIIIR